MKNFIKNSVILSIIFSFFLMGTNVSFAITNLSSASRINSVNTPSPSPTSTSSVSTIPVIPHNTTNTTSNHQYRTPVPFSIVTATASNITQTSATFNASINPGGTTVNVWYEDTSANILPGSTVTGITGNTPVAISPFNLTGLTANTSYTYKLVVTDGPDILTQNITFTTLAITPSILSIISVSAPTSGITQTTATLNASVNPNGSTINVWYEDMSANILPGSIVTGITGNIPVSIPPYSLTGLTANTTYTYKLIATDGPNLISQNITFTTNHVSGGGNGNGGGGSGSYILPFVYTANASMITNKSATLNGMVDPNGYSADAWFEYGTSSSLSTFTTTNHIEGGSGNSAVPMLKNITGLLPNTTYYFRTAAQNSHGVKKGEINHFKTTNAPIIDPNLNDNPPVVIDSNLNDNPPTEETNTENQTQEVIPNQNPLLEITTSYDKLRIGDEIEYLVSFTNNTNKDFKNIKIVTQAPSEVDLGETSQGEIGNDNTIIFNTDTLTSGQTGSMLIKGTVNSLAKNESVLVTTATMSYVESGSTVEKSEIAYVVTHIIETGFGLSAASIFGSGGFLPNTLLGWIILILITLCLLFAVWKIYSSYSLKRNIPENADHITNLPS